MGNRRKDMKGITCLTFSAFIWALCIEDVTCGIQVLAPRVLRPYNSYQVALVSSGLRSASVLVSVDGRRSNGQPFSQSKEVHLMPSSARLVDFEVGDPGPGSYELTVKSTAGTQFSSSAPVIYQNKSFCIFVQTDKRVYQPKDTVNFRAIALDKYLLPLNGYVDVTIFDAGGSPVRQWIQAPLDRGILADEFVLADQPALGEWTIQVETKSQKYDTRILIADYVEPKFSIVIDVPKTILFAEGKFTAVITAKYFNGLPVRGELTLAAFPIFFSDVIQPVVSSPTRKVVIIDGSVNVTFDMKRDLNLAEDAARPLIIEALIEEENTGRRQNVSTRTLLMRTPYRLHLHNPGHFKPGLPFNIQLEAVNSEGKLYKDGSGTATVTRIWDDGSPPNETTVQIHGGIGLYSFIPDHAHNMSTLNFEVTYMNVKERINNIKSSFAIGGQFINSQLVGGKVTAGSDINLLVRITEDIDMLNYVVLGRGDILLAKTEEIAPPRNSLNVIIPSTNLMAPGAVVLLWYPRLTGEIISTALHIPVEGILQNKVEVGIAPTQSRPAGSAEFSLITSAGSHGGILGLDMETVTTKLTQTDGLGNGLSMDMITREIESFGGLSHGMRKGEESTLATEIGDVNAADTFQKCGVVILTDGIVNEINPSVSTTPPPMIETGTRPPLAGPYAFSRLPPPPAPRFYLASQVQPTWVFANLTVGPDGRGLITRKVPTVLGDWLVGGFAVHPTLGLGLATPASFTSTQTLSLSVDLPPSLQKGESIALVVSLTSTLTAEASVELTFHNSEQYFEFEPLSNDLGSPKKIELYRRQKVSIPARGTKTTAFLITTVRTGQAPVIIEASGNGLSASFYTMLTVEPIGEEEEMTSWEILDARRGIAKANLTLTPPLGARTGDISMLVAGDLMAPALNSLKKLPRLSGDADQAIHPVVVGCTLLNYLQATERDEAGIIATAQSLLEAGNQRVLAYRTTNGSFSIDAENKLGDVWMTSLAARWLSQTARFVPISPVPAQDASKWLVQQQQPDGSWSAPSKSRVAPHLQRSVPLTALALMALLDGQGSSILYKNEINKALDYLVKQLPTEEEPFSLAILAKALSAARHPERLQPLQLLDLHAKTKDNQRWWGRKVPDQEKRSPWTVYNTIDIETTAYGLQALLDADLVDDALPVARWLLAAGPQDNSAKMEALASLALKIRTSNKLHLTASLIGTQETRQFNIEDNNSLIVQEQLVKNIRNISIVTDGRGFAVAGLKAPVVTNVTGAWPRFTLDPRVDRTSTIYKLQLSICSGFVAVGNETGSGMTLMKVRLPSGFTADLDTLTALQSANHVRSAELSRDGTEVYAWLSPMTTREYCATLITARTYPVARQKPGWVKLQDCYDSSHRARVFFNPIRGTLCDACRKFDSCSNVCGNPSSQIGEALGGDDASSKKSSADNLTTTSLCSVIILSLVNLYFHN